jgi:prevent-host-death family protein
VTSIGIRELRQNASRYLRAVEERKETIEITDRGRPIALLTPIPQGSRVEELIASGRIRRGRRGRLPSPIAPAAGVPLPSVTLEEQRADER